MPKRSPTPGRNPSTITWEFRVKAKKISFALGDLRFKVRLFLFRLRSRKRMPQPLMEGFSWRNQSPPSGFSTLITSAPKSARRWVQYGPGRVTVKSRTRKPFKADIVYSLLFTAELAKKKIETRSTNPAKRGTKQFEMTKIQMSKTGSFEFCNSNFGFVSSLGGIRYSNLEFNYDISLRSHRSLG